MVRSLYGRFWCRSSLEVLRQWRAGMWSRAMWRGQPSGSVRFGAIVTNIRTSLRASGSAPQILTVPGSKVSAELLIPASLARALTEPFS